MAEFFINIWNWIRSNAGVIAGVLTPANLILIVTAFIQMLRQKKAIAANTGSNRELKESLKENKELSKQAEKLRKQIDAGEAQLDAIKDDIGQCITKMNCILEVQQQAYSVSLAKTSTLDAINGIIANGKFAQGQARQAIIDEVADLREKLEELSAASRESEKKVKRMAGNVGEEPAETKGVRYD